MPRLQLEYIWLDGTDDQDVRSKTRIIEVAMPTEDQQWLNVIPEWGFDGSSTMQAEGNDSDCLLVPVKVYPDPFRQTIWSVDQSHLVLCEVRNADGSTHISNHRERLVELAGKYETAEVWVAIEQEYTLFKDGRPFGWPENGDDPEEQGPYYCSPDRNAGGRIADRHKDVCLDLGMVISGINAEVMLGQWEYQLGPVNPLIAADDLVVSRWLLKRLATLIEDAWVSFAPKPIAGDWNGAGAHVNFSTMQMRAEGGIKVVRAAENKLRLFHKEHIKVYGKNNDQRMTGKHETASMDTFTMGDSDRGASVRIPLQVLREERGYLEDRRPAANMNPYLVLTALLETILGEGFIAPENL